jgi:hypothetical protein
MESAFQQPVNALEIGVCHADYSTQIWLQTLHNKSKLVLLDSWKPYSSPADITDNQEVYQHIDESRTDAFLTAYLNVRKFETQMKDRDINISLLRGDSKEILPLFAESAFDFIYIDGDHKYDCVKSDIINAKRLVNKEYGIICGDDLELYPAPLLLNVAENNKDRDFIRDPFYFHPGVCLAVHEEFGAVNMVNGFWWIACVNGKFRPNVLRADLIFPTNT